MHNPRRLNWLDRFRRTIQTVGVDTFITTLSGTILIVAILVSWIFPPIYDYIASLHIYEALILVTLTQLLWQVSVRQKESGVRVIEEDEVVQEINSRVVEGKISSVKMLSAGIASRVTLIAWLVNQGIRVQVLTQDPNTAIDKSDAARLAKNVDTVISGVFIEQNKGLLDIRSYLGTASTRCVILYNKQNKPDYVYVGWYTYHERGKKLRGFINPTVACDPHSKWGERLTMFAEREFERNLAESGENLVERQPPNNEPT